MRLHRSGVECPQLHDATTNTKPHNTMTTTDTYRLASNLVVESDTILKHWTTSDMDYQGYLTQNGTARTLCEARAISGAWILFAETNGDPAVLYEGEADDFIALMTSANSDQTREDVIKAILDAIQDLNLRDWTADTLNAA